MESLKSDTVSIALGAHPECPGEDVSDLYARLVGSGACAVGEVGLDKRWENWERQLEVFREQLAIAEELSLPVLVHCVRAHDTLVRELRAAGLTVPVVLHAYSGSRDLVPVYAKLGCYFSFAGPVGWAGGRRMPRACAAVPPSRLLIETDAPYLAPEPHRGEPCRPSWLTHVAQAVAAARGVTYEEIATLTTANAERVFCG